MTPARERSLVAGALALGLLVVFREALLGHLRAGRDLFQIFIPETAYLLERLQALEVPWWTTRQRLGQPFAATLYSQALYPPRVLLALALGPARAVTASIVLHAAWASAGAYRAARALGGRPLTAALAGVFGFTPLFVRLSDSLHVVSALAWAGWVVAAAVAVNRQPGPRAAAWLALGVAACFFAGCPEVLVWLGPLAVVVAASSRTSRTSRTARAQAIGWALTGPALGLGLASVLVLPALELLRVYQPPGDTVVGQLQWSTSLPQLLSMAALRADFPTGAYLGPDQHFTSSLFVGALPCALALLALRRRRNWPLAVIGGICAALALGVHFPPAAWVLQQPPFASFRFPVKYAFGAALCIALLSSQGARELLVLWRGRRPSQFALAAVVVGGPLVIALVSLAVGMAGSRAREGIGTGLFWALAWGWLAAVGWMVAKHASHRRLALTLVVPCLAMLELQSANALTPPTSMLSAAELERPSSLAAALRADAPGRISIRFAEPGVGTPAPSEAEARPIDGAEYLRTSRENLVPLRFLEEGLTSLEGYGFRDWWRLERVIGDETSGAFAVLGVTHRVRHGAPPLEGTSPMASSAVAWAQAYRSPGAFPRAWLVQRARVASDDEAQEALRRTPEVLRSEVLLAPGQALAGTPCESPAPVVTANEESLAVEVDACASSYLVMSDAFFPGWIASVDGSEVPLQRADFLIRAVPVAAGRHQVDLSYRPASVRLGALGSGASLLLVSGLLWRRRKTS